MESAFFYNTFFAVASPEPVPEPEPEFLVSTLPDDVLAHISKFINPKLEMMERYKKLEKKIAYYTNKPVEEYCAEAERWGYKETPKCYKGYGKIYKKAKEEHLDELKTEIWRIATEKGRKWRNALCDKWEDLYYPPSSSPTQLPDIVYESITGTKRLFRYQLDGSHQWVSRSSRI
jgi:hypothetical protein